VQHIRLLLRSIESTHIRLNVQKVRRGAPTLERDSVQHRVQLLLLVLVYDLLAGRRNPAARHTNALDRRWPDFGRTTPRNIG
jgi:hypothetical protein